MTDSDSGVFRRDVVVQDALDGVGDPILLIRPGWRSWLPWTLLSFVSVVVLLSLTLPVSTYAEGPAIVRVQPQTTIVSTVGGVVTSVPIAVGTSVASGDTLVTLDAELQERELLALDAEYRTALVRLLAAPDDSTARVSVGTLRAQKALAEFKVAQRRITALGPGIVSDVRVTPGQNVVPGETLATLQPAQPPIRVTAFLPGRYRRELSIGQSIRITLADTSEAPYEGRIVGTSDVVGPTEARRVLGPGIADSLSLAGPVVIVSADVSLPPTLDSRKHALLSGMTGTARVLIGSDALFYVVFPSLRRPHD